MSVKKYHLWMVFGCFFALSISMIFMSGLAVATANDDATPVAADDIIETDEAPNTIEKPSSSGVSLQLGDIICQTGKWDWLIPGHYSHTQMYVGNGKVIESDPDGGVHYSSASDGDVYRVSTSSTTKSNAVNFVKACMIKLYRYRLKYFLVNYQGYFLTSSK